MAQQLKQVDQRVFKLPANRLPTADESNNSDRAPLRPASKAPLIQSRFESGCVLQPVGGGGGGGGSPTGNEESYGF